MDHSWLNLEAHLCFKKCSLNTLFNEPLSLIRFPPPFVIMRQSPVTSEPISLWNVSHWSTQLNPFPLLATFLKKNIRFPSYLQFSLIARRCTVSIYICSRWLKWHRDTCYWAANALIAENIIYQNYGSPQSHGVKVGGSKHSGHQVHFSPVCHPKLGSPSVGLL